MTLIEKKQSLKRAIEQLSDDQVDSVFNFVEQIRTTDTARIDFIKSLIEKEKNLFDRLAQ